MHAARLATTLHPIGTPVEEGLSNGVPWALALPTFRPVTGFRIVPRHRVMVGRAAGVEGRNLDHVCLALAHFDEAANRNRRLAKDFEQTIASVQLIIRRIATPCNHSE